MSNGIIGKGTKISFTDATDASGSSYVDLAEVFSVGYPEVDIQDVKVTHYLTSGNLHEYIAGWGEGGEVEVQMNYTKDQQEDLHGLIRLKKLWKITLPDNSKVTWQGYLKKVGAEIPNEDKITGKATIKVCSEPQFVAA